MNHYQISSPRGVFATGAVAMTALTIALCVVLPAKVQSDRNARTLAASKLIAPAPVQAVADRLRVEVVEVREPDLVSARVRSAQAKRKRES